MNCPVSTNLARISLKLAKTCVVSLKLVLRPTAQVERLRVDNQRLRTRVSELAEG
jgi:hypothetical protein